LHVVCFSAAWDGSLCKVVSLFGYGTKKALFQFCIKTCRFYKILIFSAFNKKITPCPEWVRKDSFLNAAMKV
jgi:hypothetical protein